MNNFKQLSFENASIINDNLCIESNHINIQDKVINAKYLVAIDDDITSAIMAAFTAKRMVEEGQNPPIILCVGGKGMMSFWTHKTSEAQNLANVIEEILPKEYYSDIVLLDKGTNTGKNICDIRDYISNNGNGTVIFCLTKRLSLRLYLTQDFQAKKLNAFYNVSDFNLKDACQWYNYKILCDNRMMYHELAAILPRCAEYQGKFQSKIPDKFMTSEFVEASNFLSKHYKIKLTRNPFASLGEYLKLIYALYKNKSIIKASRETVIREAKIDLRCKA